MKGNEIIKGKNKMNVQTDGLSIDVSDLKKQYYIIHIIGENGIEKFRWLKE